ncbi:MAG: prolyl oligopeptidase family serine peptidase [Vicinamibacterales bacterium]
MRRAGVEQRLDQMSVTMDQRELAVGGRSVTYGTLVPKAPPPESGYPLIVGLHFGTSQEPGLSPYFGLGFVGQLVFPALESLNAVIVAPDAPEFSWAHPDSEAAVVAVVAAVKKDHPIDEGKTLVTGFSMGGQGTWFFAATHPELFRAAIPMSGHPLTTRVRSRADVQAAAQALDAGTDWASPLVPMPIYAIHSRADTTVPIEPVERAIRVLKERGGDATLVVLDGVPHSMVPGFIEPLDAARPWILGVWNR